MKFHLGLGSKARGFFISSPAKKKPLNEEIQVGKLESGFGFRSADYGMIYLSVFIGKKKASFLFLPELWDRLYQLSLFLLSKRWQVDSISSFLLSIYLTG